MENLSVFVFTLGLTEAWYDKRDGTVFPLAPGVSGGEYRKEYYEFRNYGVDETSDDLSWCIKFIREKNPEAKFIITVSPVPLNATAVKQHVLLSTVYSKSVLRVSAERVCNSFDLTDYFPSYEIITSPHALGRYFAEDCRSVTEAGVEHVMSVFLKHYGITGWALNISSKEVITGSKNKIIDNAAHLQEMERIIMVLCDEEEIDNR